MFSDWRKHKDSDASLKAIRLSGGVPLGGGVNKLRIVAPDTLPRKLAYVNDKLGRVSGVQFVEVAHKVTATPATFSLLAMWDDNDLSANYAAYMWEVRHTGSQSIYTLRKGPGTDGEVLLQQTLGSTAGVWQQLGMQIFFDALGNLHIIPAVKQNGVILFISFTVTDDSLWDTKPEVQIPRNEARFTGKVGLIVTTEAPGNIEFDYFRVRTQKIL